MTITNQYQPRKRARPRAIVIGVIIGVPCTALLVAAAMNSDDEDFNPAKAVCVDYGTAVTDYKDGLMTDAEFRADLRGIVDDARYTDAEQYSRDAMAAVTGGTTAEMTATLSAFMNYCNSTFA